MGSGSEGRDFDSRDWKGWMVTVAVVAVLLVVFFALVRWFWRMLGS